VIHHNHLTFFLFWIIRNRLRHPAQKNIADSMMGMAMFQKSTNSPSISRAKLRLPKIKRKTENRMGTHEQTEINGLWPPRWQLIKATQVGTSAMRNIARAHK
jgi:hypothetical protein